MKHFWLLFLKHPLAMWDHLIQVFQACCSICHVTGIPRFLSHVCFVVLQGFPSHPAANSAWAPLGTNCMWLSSKVPVGLVLFMIGVTVLGTFILRDTQEGSKEKHLSWKKPTVDKGHTGKVTHWLSPNYMSEDTFSLDRGQQILVSRESFFLCSNLMEIKNKD